MTDTNITLNPATAHASGAMALYASAALFTASDVGRLVAVLHRCDTVRVAATAYAVGKILISEYNQVPRLYRVIKAGTTAAANMAGTTPNYDLAAPNETTNNVLDGTAILKYLGPGRHVWGWARITAYVNTTEVTVDVDPTAPFAATYSSLRWRMGEFSDARGWPAAGVFHKGRLWLAGTTTRPQTLWASRAGDFEDFSPADPDGTVLDSSAITIALDDDQVSRIHWLVGVPRGLVAGTASGEVLVAPANRNGPIAPANVTADRQSDRGSDATGKPVRLSGVLLFPQRGGRHLRQFDYDYASDRFATPDLTALANHIAGPGFVETAYADVPAGTFWGLRGDGRIAALTVDPDEKLRAWTLIELGGDAVVESIAAVPDPAGSGSDLYCAVARTVAGATVRTIEFIRSPFRADLDGAAAGYFLDGGLSYSGDPVTSVTGLTHLEGQRVLILADGALRQPQTVTGGVVPITGPPATVVHVGLPYRHRIVDLPPDAAATPAGPLAGRRRRVVRVSLRLLHSGGGSVAALDAPASETLAYRTVDMPMDQAVPLFTGDRTVATFGRWTDSGQVEITSADPLPFTLLSIAKEVEAG